MWLNNVTGLLLSGIDVITAISSARWKIWEQLRTVTDFKQYKVCQKKTLFIQIMLQCDHMQENDASCQSTKLILLNDKSEHTKQHQLKLEK